jgi:1,4-alpha-glucan branching enzyme
VARRWFSNPTSPDSDPAALQAAEFGDAQVIVEIRRISSHTTSMHKRHTRPSGVTRPVEKQLEPVEFVFEMPDASAVAVAGSFNDWDPRRTPMRKNAAGAWTTTVALAPGHYEYRFVVDGKWISDPKAPSVINPFGATNSVLDV